MNRTSKRWGRRMREVLGLLARRAGSLAVQVFRNKAGGVSGHCATPLELAPPARAAAAWDTEGAHTLRLLSYNIWGLPGWMTGASSGRYARIARELDRLAPDIVLLQEVWTAKARHCVPATGDWWRARAAGQHTFFQQSGLITLSRFPITGGWFCPFSQAAFPDRLVSKGILKTTISLPGGSVVNVWNVHLQEGGPVAIRQSQVQELVACVHAAENGQIADLVGGDFNCTPGSPLYQRLEQELGPTVYTLGGDRPFVTWHKLTAKPDTGRTLDYIFVRARRALQRVEALARVAFSGPSPSLRLSDHLGLEAVVTLSLGAALIG